MFHSINIARKYFFRVKNPYMYTSTLHPSTLPSNHTPTHPWRIMNVMLGNVMIWNTCNFLQFNLKKGVHYSLDITRGGISKYFKMKLILIHCISLCNLHSYTEIHSIILGAKINPRLESFLHLRWEMVMKIQKNLC